MSIRWWAVKKITYKCRFRTTGHRLNSTFLIWYLRYSIPNALVYHSKHAYQILWKNQGSYILKASWNDNLISKFYFFDKYKFCWPYLLPWRPYKNDFVKSYEENIFFTIIKKALTDIITIFGRVWYMYLGISSLKNCVFPPQIIWVIEIVLPF